MQQFWEYTLKRDQDQDRARRGHRAGLAVAIAPARLLASKAVASFREPETLPLVFEWPVLSWVWTLGREFGQSERLDAERSITSHFAIMTSSASVYLLPQDWPVETSKEIHRLTMAPKRCLKFLAARPVLANPQNVYGQPVYLCDICGWLPSGRAEEDDDTCCSVCYNTSICGQCSFGNPRVCIDCVEDTRQEVPRDLRILLSLRRFCFALLDKMEKMP